VDDDGDASDDARYNSLRLSAETSDPFARDDFSLIPVANPSRAGGGRQP
jgi:hypothetical protein